MTANRKKLIEGLAGELSPVRPFRERDGVLLLAGAFLATVAAVLLVEGLWLGAFRGEAAPFFWVTNGILLLLGLASAAAVVAMASPAVGNRHDAPKWSAAMLGVLPLAAIIPLLSNDGAVSLQDHSSLHCFIASLMAATFTGGAMTWWLRRGAPVSLELAGWFTGLAAGALGTLVYGFSCSLDSITHLGIWHVAPVAVAAAIGRLAVPRLVKW